MADVTDAISTMGFGPAQIYTEILAHGIWLVDGMELTLAAILTLPIRQGLLLSETQTASLASVVWVGLAVGGVLSGRLGDIIGRRWAILLGYLAISGTSLICATAKDYPSLLAFRFSMGVAMSLGMSSSLALVNEMAPVNWRVGLMGMRGVMFSLGNVLAILMVILNDSTMNNLHWRVILACAATVPLFFGTLSAFFLQESPIWLAKTGRCIGANAVLSWVARQNGSKIPHQVYEACAAEVDGPCEHTPWRYQLSVVFNRHFIFYTFVLSYACFTVNFVEHGSAYAEPRVFGHMTHAQMEAGWQLFAKYTINVPVRIGILLAAVRISHKHQFIGGSLFGYILGLILFVWTGGMQQRSGWCSFLYFAGQYLPLLGNGFVSLSALHMSVEIYPTVATATSAGVINAFGRLGSIIAPFLFECLHQWQEFYYFMIVFSLMLLFLGILLPAKFPIAEEVEVVLPFAMKKSSNIA